MTAVFDRILEMSLTAAIVIVVVLLIRLLLRKAPRKYSYALWSVAAFRLVCPVSFRAAFSLFNFTKQLDQGPMETIFSDSAVSQAPVVSPGYFDSVPPGTGTPVEIDPDYMFTLPITTPPAAEAPAAASIDWMQVATIVWLFGLAALLIYGIVSYVRLRRRMSTAVVLEGRVWQSDRVQSPFILGFVRPKIYLPFGLSADQQRYVLAHEGYHIKRLDHIVRPLSFLILAVHWFNPFVWLAYYLMSHDMEMSCDEKVLSTEENIRKAYSTTLLSFAANRRFPSPSPLAFGESGVKGRIKNALNWKKPRTWVTIIAIILCIVVIIVCAANPVGHPYDWTKNVTVEDVEWAELMVNGTERSYRRLSDGELEELVGLLNAMSRDEMEQPPAMSGWGFPTERMLTLCCGGAEYALNLGPGPMTIHGDDSVDWERGDPWFIGNQDLKQFVKELPEGYPEADNLQEGLHTYEAVRCVYRASVVENEGDDSGYYYAIGDNLVQILRKDDKGLLASFSYPTAWQPLSDEEWTGMFMDDTLPEGMGLTGYKNPLVCNLSGSYALVDMDGTLWMVYLMPGLNRVAFISEIYELREKEPENMESVVQQVDLTHDGIDEILTVSAYTGADSGNADSVWIRVNNTAGEQLFQRSIYAQGSIHDSVSLYEKDGKTWLLLVSMTGDPNGIKVSYVIQKLNETGGADEESMISAELVMDRTAGVTTSQWEEFKKGLDEVMAEARPLAMGGGGQLQYSSPDNLMQSITLDLNYLFLTEEPEILSVWQADLTQDGVDETVTVWETIPGDFWEVVVTKADGTEIWRDSASWAHVGQNGLYIYEHNGVQYLMRWNPYGSTGGYSYHYKIFALSETGEELTLTGKSFDYDTNSDDQILSINIEGMRAYEDGVNDRLAQSIVLIATYDFEPVYSTQDNPVTRLWESPADYWEEMQQWVRDKHAEQLENTLAMWTADVHHGGEPETITVLKKAEDCYVIEVHGGGNYFLWSSQELRPQAGDLFYLLYEEDGKEYIAELSISGRQGIGMWQYRIFSIGPESIDVIRENSLYYDSVGVEALLAVDTAKLRAFEAEVNGLFYNAQPIAFAADGNLFHVPYRGAVVFRWSSDEAERIEELQSYWRDMEKKLNAAVTGQMYRYYAENLRWYSIQGFGQYVMLDSRMDKQGATAWVVASFIEIDGDGNWMGEYSNIPMMFTFDMVDEEYVLTEAWIEEKGANFDVHRDVKARFPAEAAQAVIDGTYTQQLRQSLLADWEQPYRDLTMDAPDGVLDYALSYILSTHPDAQAAQINSIDEISTGAVGTTSGIPMYKLVYNVKLDGRWHLLKKIYLVLHHDWSGSSDYWYACGTVTQQEIDATYSTEAMMEQYNNDPYLAASMEIHNQWYQWYEKRN